MRANNELVAIAKTWLQRDEQFPIDFDEIWERAGYTERGNAKRAFEACVRNFSMMEGLDYLSFKMDRSDGLPGKPRQSWGMTIRSAKRFLASAQTKEGYAVIDALILAEEELQAIKAGNWQGSEEGLSEMDILARMCQSMADQQRRQKQAEMEAEKHSRNLAKLEKRFDDYYESEHDDGYRTLSAYAKRIGIKPAPNDKQLSLCGRVASAIWCSLYGDMPKKSGHRKYDNVNAYPIDFLNEHREIIFKSILR